MFYTEDILVTVKLATSGGGYESDVDFEKWGQVKNEIYYDNMDDLNFPFVNFRSICKCSNIPAAFAYEIYLSQLLLYIPELVVLIMISLKEWNC
jgi:hypothetical protein